jgi:hypothetical protein
MGMTDAATASDWPRRGLSTHDMSDSTDPCGIATFGITAFGTVTVNPIV